VTPLDGPCLLSARVPPARLGAELAAARSRAGLSRAALARQLAVPRRWLRRWEEGRARIPDVPLERALAVLGLELHDLLPVRVPVRYDEADAALVLGDHRRPAHPSHGNHAVLVAYAELVAEARGASAASVAELRHDDLVVLADLLDLDDDRLEAHLADVLAVSPAHASALRSRLTRHRLAAGARDRTSGARSPRGGGSHGAVWRSLALVPKVPDGPVSPIGGSAGASG